MRKIWQLNGGQQEGEEERKIGEYAIRDVISIVRRCGRDRSHRGLRSERDGLLAVVGRDRRRGKGVANAKHCLV